MTCFSSLPSRLVWTLHKKRANERRRQSNRRVCYFCLTFSVSVDVFYLCAYWPGELFTRRNGGVVVVLSSVVRILRECSTIYFLPACFCCCCCCLSGDRLAHTNSTPYARISSQWFSNLRRLWPNVMYIYKISCVCFHEKTRWLNSLQKCMCNQIVRHFFFFSVCVWKPYFCTICHDRRC